MASSTSKKPKLRLKKQVKRTLGGIFLASAVAVAAIPASSRPGGEVAAAVNADGTGFTHTVQDDYKGNVTYNATTNAFVNDGLASVHNEIYGDKDYTGYAVDFKETTTADGSAVKSFYSDGSNIPECDPGMTGSVPKTTIYSTGDGDFQFAYVDSTGSQTGGGNKNAIILGFNHQGSLAGGILTIPDYVDAYLNFNDNDGSSTGFCSVGKSGNFLFYESEVSLETPSSLYYYLDPEKAAKTDTAGKTMYYVFIRNDDGTWPGTASLTMNADALAAYAEDTATNGTEYHATDNPTGNWKKEVIYVDQYHNFLPCYYATFATWKDKNLYYYETENYKPTGTPKTGAHYDTATTPNLIPQIADVNDESYGRISGAMVTAIGKQYIEADNSNGWKIAGNINETNGTTKGIFANNSYITTLNIGGNLSGIGDYAFYGCTNMSSITTGNGLNTLGNHAFDNCRNMKNVNIPLACNLITIGAYCFKNCQALQTFTLPTSVTTIGDGAFKGCWKIQTIDLGATGEYNGSLTNIGVLAFADCQALKQLDFPQGFSQTMIVASFEGCKSLEKITALNSNFNIDVCPNICDYGWEEFKIDQNDGSDIKDKFYIESPSSGILHKTCTDNEVSYKYPGQDVYELTKKERGKEGVSPVPTVTYQVDSNNVLTDTKFNGQATSLTFPEYIGPYHIEQIGDYAFQDQCSLTEVTIASTISRIGAGAFMGCHNLKYVFFNTDSVEIGDYAFQTQQVSTHQAGCSEYAGKDSGENNDDSTKKDIVLHDKDHMTDTNNQPTVQLGFVGSINVDATPYQYAMSYDGRYNNGSQNTSFITYYSGWPTMLTVKYNMTDTVTHEGYSELIDFPTATTLATYATKDYLTTEYKAAASKAISDAHDGKPLTEDAQIFTDSAKQLTVPTGIDAIKDGLFASLTAAVTNPMDLVLEGINHIEFGGTLQTDGTLADGDKAEAITKSDFYGCPKLGNIILSGKTGAPDTKIIDTYAFADNAAAKSLIVNCPVDTIGKRAFYNDAALETAEFAGTVNSIGEEAFAKDTALTSFSATNTIGSIGDHAFLDDAVLTTVSFAENVSSLGIRPWGGCEKLSTVGFGNGTSYACEDSIVYEMNEGVKRNIVELLEGRTKKVSSDEVSTCTGMNKEAFMGTNVKSINLLGSKITEIPTHAFADTTSLREVILPSAQTAAGVVINDYAFEGSNVEEITGESNISLISPVATDGILTPSGSAAVAQNANGDAVTNNTNTGNNSNVTIYAPEGTTLYRYATMYNFNVETTKEVTYWTVTFRDWDAASSTNVTVATLSVANGEAVDPYYIPTPTGKEGFVFDTWYSSNESTLDEVYADTVFTANYVTPTATVYAVTFKDYQGAVYKTYNIESGETLAENNIDVENLKLPDVEVGGVLMSHAGWLADGEITTESPITRDVTFNPSYSLANGPFNVYLQYLDPSTAETVIYKTIKDVAKGTDVTSDVNTTASPYVTGYTFNGWSKASISPTGSDLTNVTRDIYVTGTFSSGSGNGGNGSGGNGGSTSQEQEEAVARGDAFWAYYYMPNGVDLYSKIAITKGDKAYDVVKPTGYTTGYEWSPKPSETTMDANHNFILVASEGTDLVGKYTASYYYTDGVTLYQQLSIESGANAPNLMMPAGYTQCVWSPDPTATEITKDTRFTMVAGPNYTPGGTGTVGPYYTLTVVNGSGSGSYPAGTQAIIVANEPESGKMFGSWTISPDNTPIASKGLSATVITMPSENVTVTANYVTKTSSGGGSGSGSSGNNGSGSGTTPTPSKTSSGTTVVIEKNGLSNTGVVSAVVNGSSDNFTIKITEQSAASEAVLKALQAQFGDVNKIMYFPMDISLYDASGDKKITDTTGLTVTITLPLPDSLIPYGGNNKVAAVVNNQLDILSPKFTTINGVDCVTFTCTHFSPYVIYVNTEQISLAGDNSNGPSDQTPKTGDGIKPKWFLATGLAAIGVFFFVWTDKRRKKVIAK